MSGLSSWAASSKPVRGERASLSGRVVNGFQEMWWLLLLPGLASLAVLSLKEGIISPLLISGLLLIVGVLFVRLFVPREFNDRATCLFLSVYGYSVFVVVLVCVLLIRQHGSPYLPGQTDDWRFDVQGRIASHDITLRTGGVSSKFATRYAAYVRLLGVVHRLGDILWGTSTLNPRLLNSLALGLAAVVVFLLANQCGLSDRMALMAAYAFGFFPLSSYWGALVVRDALVCFLITLATYTAVRMIRTRRLVRRLLYLSLLGAVFAGVWALRYYSAIHLLVALVAGVISLLWSHRVRVRQYALIVIIICAGFFALQFAAKSYFAGIWSDPVGFVEYVASRASTRKMAISSGYSAAVFSAPLLPFGWIMRSLYGLIVPFPSLALDPLKIYESVGSLARLMLLPFVLLSLTQLTKKANITYVAVVTVVLYLVPVLTTFQMRHMLYYYPGAFILSAYGFGLTRKHRWSILFLWALCLASLGTIYFALG